MAVSSLITNGPHLKPIHQAAHALSEAEAIQVLSRGNLPRQPCADRGIKLRLAAYDADSGNRFNFISEQKGRALVHHAASEAAPSAIGLSDRYQNE
jgi:hypothetical protein